MQVCDMCGEDANEHFAEKHGLEYLRCTKCSFVFSNTTDFDFTSFNEEIIEDLQSLHVSKLDSPRHLKHYRQLLKEFEPYRQTGRFLEIGCSTGSFLSKVRDAGWQECGVEPVASSARYGIDELGLNIHVGVLETAELASDSFDVVYSNAAVSSTVSTAAYRCVTNCAMRFFACMNMAILSPWNASMQLPG